ncbi:MAG: hypothetical protein M1829_004481 [Trizodia sp. TS-e1964]|nr:MAG: hypothetical protein M1829_004481 [Trizodia sp. TS-e1964]
MAEDVGEGASTVSIADLEGNQASQYPVGDGAALQYSDQGQQLNDSMMWHDNQDSNPFSAYENELYQPNLFYNNASAWHEQPEHDDESLLPDYQDEVPFEQPDVRYNMPKDIGETISPSALESGPAEVSTAPSIAPTPPVVSLPLPSSIPASFQDGDFLRKDRGECMMAGYAAIPDLPGLMTSPAKLEISAKGTVIPRCVPRMTMNERRKLGLISKDSSNPKRVKSTTGRPKKTTQVSSSQPSQISNSGKSVSEEYSSSEQDDTSDYDSSGSEEMLPKAPLPPVRPTDRFEGIAYDIIKAVWQAPGIATQEEIRSSLNNFWELFKDYIAGYNAETVKLKQAEDNKRPAEENKKPAESPASRPKVPLYRRIVKHAIDVTLEFGHPHVVEMIGENERFMAFAAKVLQEKLKDGDLNGELSTQILKLISQFVTISEELLESIKLGAKFQARYLKKGSEETKDLWRKIVGHATATTAKRIAKIAEANAVTEQRDQAKAAALKRARETDQASGAPPAKRPNPSGPGTGRRPLFPSAPPVKNAHVNPKGVPFVGVKAPTPVPKPAYHTSAVSESANAAHFSFAATMASINQPEEDNLLNKPVKVRPPETDEERRKREHKEARRKLKVRFKPDDVLVQIRYFTYDKAEKIGRGEGMLRDAHDAMSEGRAFKEHLDLNTIDEDDELFSKEWTTPKIFDFSTLPAEIREKNFVSRGGLKQPDSPEQFIQDKREANTLMVVYSDPSSIPWSPREPQNNGSRSVAKAEVLFGSPWDNTLRRESRFGPNQHHHSYRSRIRASDPRVPPEGNNIGGDIAKILSQFSTNKIPAPQPPTQAIANAGASSTTNIFEVFARFTENSAPVQPTALPPPNSTNMEEIFARFSGPRDPNQQPHRQKTIAEVYQELGIQMPQQPPPVHQQQIATADSKYPYGYDLAAIMASVRHLVPAAAPTVVQAPPPLQNDNLQAILAQLGASSNGDQNLALTNFGYSMQVPQQLNQENYGNNQRRNEFEQHNQSQDYRQPPRSGDEAHEQRRAQSQTYQQSRRQRNDNDMRFNQKQPYQTSRQGNDNFQDRNMRNNQMDQGWVGNKRVKENHYNGYSSRGPQNDTNGNRSNMHKESPEDKTSRVGAREASSMPFFQKRGAM